MVDLERGNSTGIVGVRLTQMVLGLLIDESFY